MERLTAAGRGVGRGGGKGWGSCGEAPLPSPDLLSAGVPESVFWGRTREVARILLTPKKP